MTVTEALRVTRARLEAAGIESAEAEAWTLLGHSLGVSRSELLLSRARLLSAAEHQALDLLLSRRERREPLQHILGVAHFYGLTLRVTPATLIPRPETETLVELGLNLLTGKLQPQVLDVGTGSGAIALAFKAERPDALVWATDLAPAALAVAEANAQRLALEVHFVTSDLLLEPSVGAFAQRADLLVSNPPYLPQSDARWLSPEVQRDPPAALFSGADGLAHFRQLTAQAFSRLEAGAVCLLELDPRNVALAQRESARWSQVSVHNDLLGRARFLRLTR